MNVFKIQNTNIHLCIFIVQNTVQNTKMSQLQRIFKNDKEHGANTVIYAVYGRAHI